MEDFSNTETDKYITEYPNDFTEDIEEDLDETLCAECGLSRDECHCFELYRVDTYQKFCNCCMICSCCPRKLCDCEFNNGVQ